MPQSIPHGLTRDHVLAALADLDAGMEHPFGKPTGYELVHGGKRYPPKAVVGLAFRHFKGQMLQPSEFSGGEAPDLQHYVPCTSLLVSWPRKPFAHTRFGRGQ